VRKTGAGVLTPNLFIIGVPFAGAAELGRWLAGHRDVAGRGEPLHFLMDQADPAARRDGYWSTGIDGYADHFAAQGDDPRRRIDATPLYYYQGTAKTVIPALPDVHVVMVLRDPVARLLALFHEARDTRATLPEDMSFSGFVKEARAGTRSRLLAGSPLLRNAILHSHYAIYLWEWLTVLGRERLSVVTFEDLTRDPSGCLDALARVLGIDPAPARTRPFLPAADGELGRSSPVAAVARRFGEFTSVPTRGLAGPLLARLQRRRPRERMDESDFLALDELEREFAGWQTSLPVAPLVRTPSTRARNPVMRDAAATA